MKTINMTKEQETTYKLNLGANAILFLFGVYAVAFVLGAMEIKPEPVQAATMCIERTGIVQEYMDEVRTQVDEYEALQSVGKGVLEYDTQPSHYVTESVDEIAHIRAFRDTYPDNTLTDEYLDIIHNSCPDLETTERVVAIATAECGLDARRCNKTTNLWGWFKGGDWGYDPDMQTMAVDICNGIGGAYRGVEHSWDAAYVYTGGDRTQTWLNHVNSAISKMTELRK